MARKKTTKKTKPKGSDHFDYCFEHVIGIEGGYSNHPADRGGPTKYGVTLNTLKHWRRDMTLKAGDVKVLTLDEAKQIYKARYWDKWSLDAVESRLSALCLFDQAINWGIGTSVQKRAQLAANKCGDFNLRIDGDIGPKTLEAINQAHDKEFCFHYVSLAQDKYVSLVKSRASQIVFLAGWINRTQKLFGEIILGDH